MLRLLVDGKILVGITVEDDLKLISFLHKKLTSPEEIENLNRELTEGLDEAVFRRSKKALYGKYIRRSSDASGVCRMQAEAVFSGAMAFDFAEVFQNITKQEVAARVQAWAQPNRMAMAVVAPQTEG